MDDARSARMLRLVPPAVIALPVIWAVVAHAMGSAARPVATAPRRPSLAFNQHLVDLGKVSPSEEVFAHFDFRNRGKDEVTITKLVPSCGCLQPEMKQKVYYPGQAGHFLLRVQTANQKPGPKDYIVTVHYNDPEPQEAQVVFRVVLPENQVFIRPPALAVYQWSHQPQEQVIDVIDRRGQSLRVLRVECTRSNLAHVEIGDSTVDENGHTHNTLHVTIPGGLPQDRMEAVIRIHTDDPGYRALRVPLLIQGKPPSNLASPRPRIDRHVQPASGIRDDDGDR